MKRTRNRPLVRGIVTPQTATALAATTGISGGSILALGTDPVTAALGVGNIALYAGLYTYLKPRSEINTWVGAVVGAVPPVMGWTAATGGSLFDLEAALLGSTLFLWQFPHFFALSWMHRTDYARGGFQMVPVNDIDTNGDRTAALINRYTWYMSTIPIASSVLGATSSMFAVEGIVLNAYALYVAKRFQRPQGFSDELVVLTVPHDTFHPALSAVEEHDRGGRTDRARGQRRRGDTETAIEPNKECRKRIVPTRNSCHCRRVRKRSVPSSLASPKSPRSVLQPSSWLQRL